MDRRVDDRDGGSRDKEKVGVMRRYLRALLARFNDSLLAIVLVVVFFLAFIVILVLSFPKGSGLSTVFEPGTPFEAPATTTTTPGSKSDPGDWNSVLAHLDMVKRTVKLRTAGSIVWAAAPKGSDLHERDAVQTFRDSGATIVFQPSQEIALDENSLVLIRRFEKEASTGSHRASVVLLGGAIEGSIASVGGHATTVEILAGKAGATVLTTRHGAAGFRIAAGTDDSSVVSITKGEATVRVGSRAVKVSAGEVVNVSPTGVIEGPTALPQAPELSTPAKGAVFQTRTDPAGIEFQWHDDHPGRSFRFELARDTAFKDRVVDEIVSGPSFSHSGLPLGHYYWRVRSVRGPSVGRVSQPRDFEIANDSDPPALRVDYPDGPLQSGEVVIKGVAEPGAKVFVGSTPAAVDSGGAFEARVKLSRGVQVLVVEAVDSVGNVAYRSQTLTAR